MRRDTQANARAGEEVNALYTFAHKTYMTRAPWEVTGRRARYIKAHGRPHK